MQILISSFSFLIQISLIQQDLRYVFWINKYIDIVLISEDVSFSFNDFQTSITENLQTRYFKEREGPRNSVTPSLLTSIQPTKPI